jgi:hypothetical protein
VAARSQQTKVLLEKHTNNQLRKSGVPSASKPGMSTIMFGKQPGGTRGGSAPKRAGK